MNKKRVNGYFSKIFINMILTLVVPFIIIILLCAQTETTIKDQMLLFNQRILNNAFRVMDTVFEEIIDDVAKISLAQECSNYANYAVYYKDKVALQSVEVKEVLTLYGREEYADLFVYYPYNDRIISSVKGSASAEYYYASNYSKNSYDYSDEFYQILQCDSKRPYFYVMNRDGKKPYLCLVMRKKNKNSNLDYVVAAVLKPEYLKKLMYTDDIEGNGTLLIFDHNKQLLVNSDEENTPYYMRDEENLGVLYEITLEDGTAMMQVQKSENTDIYYAFATYSEYFWKEIASIRITAVVYILICIFASIVWAYWNTKKTYKPVNDILGNMQRQYKDTINENGENEFEFIERLLEKQKTEKDLLNLKLRENKNMRKNHFLTSLIVEDSLERKDDNNGFAENGIQLCSDKFLTVAMTADNLEDKEIDAFVIKNVFEEVCNRVHIGYVVNLFDGKYAILVNLKDEERLDELITELYEGIEFLQKYEFSISLAIGEVKKGMMFIHQSYKEALYALKYTYLLGKNTIIAYRDICGREFVHLTSSENMLLKRVIDFVKGKEKKTAEQMVSDLLNDYGIDENVSIETIECFQYEIIGVINRVFMLQGKMEEERNRRMKELMEQSSWSQFVDKLVLLLMLLQQEEESSQGTDEMCRQALAYIEEHYRDSDLSVAMLGESLNVSSVYLSKAFKKKYEVTILNYIAQVRIRNAKEALTDFDRNIKDIAEECGFLSSNVFIKTFKKYEGLTPGMYRDLLKV